MIKVGKVVAIVNEQIAIAFQFETHGLVHFFNFREMRVWIAIRIDETVVEEIAVCRQRGFVVVPIRPEAPALVVSHCERLVDPVPDEAALKYRECVNSVPVVLQIANGIAHGVGILDHYRWPVRTVLRVICQPFDRRIHRIEDIRIVIEPRRLVLYRSRVVPAFCPGIGFAKDVPVPCFVPE